MTTLVPSSQSTPYNPEARLFTYGHELGHVVLGDDSICAQVGGSKIEKWCEEFAAALLMPATAVRDYLQEKFPDITKLDFAKAKTFSNKFKVSFRAGTLRLISLGYAEKKLYNEVNLIAEFKKGGGGSGGETSPDIRLREWGSRFADLVTGAEGKRLLTRSDSLEYLNLSNTQLATLKERLGRNAPIPE